MKARRAVLALAAVALPAAAQAPAPEPSPAQTPAPAEERAPSSRTVPAPSPGPRLNLKLDNPSQYSRETPRDGGSAELLPSLGGDARALPAREPPSTSSSPFPQDSNPNR